MQEHKRPDNDIATTSIRWPRSLVDQLREAAEAEHRTLSAEMRRLAEQRVSEYQADTEVPA